MSTDALFAEAARRGLQLGRLCQYSYVVGDTRKTDHWEAHLHDHKGVCIGGRGRSPEEALQDALHPVKKPAQARPKRPAPLSLDFLD